LASTTTAKRITVDNADAIFEVIYTDLLKECYNPNHIPSRPHDIACTTLGKRWLQAQKRRRLAAQYE